MGGRATTKHDVLPGEAVSGRAHDHHWRLLRGTTDKDSTYSCAGGCHRRKVDLTIGC